MRERESRMIKSGHPKMLLKSAKSLVNTQPRFQWVYPAIAGNIFAGSLIHHLSAAIFGVRTGLERE